MWGPCMESSLACPPLGPGFKERALGGHCPGKLAPRREAGRLQRKAGLPGPSSGKVTKQTGSFWNAELIRPSWNQHPVSFRTSPHMPPTHHVHCSFPSSPLLLSEALHLPCQALPPLPGGGDIFTFFKPPTSCFMEGKNVIASRKPALPPPDRLNHFLTFRDLPTCKSPHDPGHSTTQGVTYS